MPSSREQTETLYVERMAVAYSPGVPRDQVTAAKAEYCDFLTRYDPAVLARAWELTRERHTGKFWPSMSEARAFCEAAARQHGASGYSPATHIAESLYQRSMRAHAAIRSMAERAAEWHGAEVDAIAAKTGVAPNIIAFHLRDVITRQAWEPVSTAIMDGRPHITDWTPSAEDWADVEGRAVSQARVRAKRAPGAKTLAEAAE